MVAQLGTRPYLEERSPSRLRRCAHTASVIVGVVVCGTVIVFASGCLARRWGVAAVPDQGAGVHMSKRAALFVVPMPSERLRAGELIVLKLPEEPREELLRIDAVSGETRSLRLRGASGTTTTITAPATVWRVRVTVPVVGLALLTLSGTVPAVLFVLLGIGLIASAERTARSGTRTRRRVLELQ